MERSIRAIWERRSSTDVCRCVTFVSTSKILVSTVVTRASTSVFQLVSSSNLERCCVALERSLDRLKCGGDLRDLRRCFHDLLLGTGVVGGSVEVVWRIRQDDGATMEKWRMVAAEEEAESDTRCDDTDVASVG